jgi:hypothetical protein
MSTNRRCLRSSARSPALAWIVTAAIAGSSGCSVDSASADDFMDEDFPPWSCDTEPTGPACTSSGGEPAADCHASFVCSDGEVCVADFDGDIGRFSCEPACIDAMDEQRWCSDDAACCDAGAVCSRGYCIPGEGSTTSGETTVDASSSGSETSVTSSGGSSG